MLQIVQGPFQKISSAYLDSNYLGREALELIFKIVPNQRDRGIKESSHLDPINKTSKLFDQNRGGVQAKICYKEAEGP